MRISISKACVVTALLSFGPSGAFAAETYVCAIGEAYECLTVTGCKRVALRDVNMSAVIALDIDKKQLSSAALGEPSRTEDIEGLSKTDKAIFLFGTQDEASWNATVSLENGALTGGITSGTSSFAIFGSCTKR